MTVRGTRSHTRIRGTNNLGSVAGHVFGSVAASVGRNKPRDAMPAPWMGGDWLGPLTLMRGHLVVFAMALFVAQTFVVDSLGQGRLVPSYQLHFDTAWRLGLQVALAAVFVATFWGVLWLGAGLFRLVGLDGFEAGMVTLAPHPLPDIVVGDQNLTIFPVPPPCS